MKWAQFINNYRKSTLGGPMMKQSILQSCFFYVLPRHTNVIIDKGYIFFNECAARCVHLFPQEEQCTYSSWGDSKMYTSGSIANSQRMLIEINGSGAIAKIKIWKWYCQTLKTFKIIFSKTKISLVILSWWYFGCLHIQRIFFTLMWA